MALWVLLCALSCCAVWASSAPRSLAGKHAAQEGSTDPWTQRRLLQDLNETSTQTVYFNGLAPGWSGSESYGCDCDFESSKPFLLLRETFVPGEERGSPAELTAHTRVMPWAAVVLQNKLGFSSQGVLDFFAKGTGLTRSEFFLENPEQGCTSRKARMSSNDMTDLPEDFLNVRDASGGSKGWMHLQMDLRKLARGPGDNWTTLVFRDVSGSGFTLQFALMRLVSVPDGFNVSAESQDTPDQFVLDSMGSSGGDEAQGSSECGGLCPPGYNEVPILNLDTSRTKDEDVSMAFAGEDPPTEFVMKLKENVTKAQLIEICRELSSPDTGRFSGSCKPRINDTADAAANSTDVLTWSFQAFKVDSEEDVLAMSKALGGTLEYIEKDMTATIAQAGISRVRSWGLDRIDQISLPLDATYNNGRLTGANTHVYLLDTGLVSWDVLESGDEKPHIDFEGRIGELRSVFGRYIPEWNRYFDDVGDADGHGTHVAGTAVGTFHGVARSAILHSVKVYKGSTPLPPAGPFSNMIAGLEWVRDHAQRNDISQAVAVLTHSGPKSWSMNDAVEEIVKAGIMVVVAAGNDRGGDACSYSPSSAPSAIVVAASTQNDRLASFSNIGSCVTLFAPGKDIVSASDLDESAETLLSGTSMAAPHVAGVVAMLLEQQPGADVTTVKEALMRAAARVQFEPSSPDLLLNAQSSRLVEALSSSSSPTNSPPTSPRPRPSWCDKCFWNAIIQDNQLRCLCTTVACPPALEGWGLGADVPCTYQRSYQASLCDRHMYSDFEQAAVLVFPIRNVQLIWLS